jgi:hypothetical protein
MATLTLRKHDSEQAIYPHQGYRERVDDLFNELVGPTVPPGNSLIVDLMTCPETGEVIIDYGLDKFELRPSLIDLGPTRRTLGLAGKAAAITQYDWGKCPYQLTIQSVEQTAHEKIAYAARLIEITRDRTQLN